MLLLSLSVCLSIMSISVFVCLNCLLLYLILCVCLSALSGLLCLHLCALLLLCLSAYFCLSVAAWFIADCLSVSLVHAHESPFSICLYVSLSLKHKAFIHMPKTADTRCNE